MRQPTRRTALFATLALAGATAFAQGAPAARDFPNKPIKVVVPSPAGGPPDLILRAMLPKINQVLGQPVIIDNRAGAGGLVGTAYVAKQPADGYTWLFTTASHVNIPPFAENVPYDPVKDFTHVTLAAQNFGQALVVNPGVEAKNLQELIALAKKHPGKLTYANAGNGTASHIPAELMKAMTGTDILSVPYKGIPEATSDLIAGRIDIFFVGTNIALQHVQNGRLRALALTGRKRWKGMPEVPTMDEQGLTGFEKVNWFGLWLPAGAPPEIVNRIHAAVVAALAEPEVKAQFDQQGIEGVAMPPREFSAFVASEAKAAQEIAHRIHAGAKK
ncbi:tripartite tricarboxylate transporter substrate binding protein [Ramlibacter alkalitolerans]|uniref:Tripartite tricarboxylate transporter substrate binding protein n=1 Tax=Ramlibacter alkalitolerans TaxID=2039631 RepID=A0ABS1JVK8_9BURK|nr:tripartite tricarboxylate transporter substrate binding protein [Ramlibacter alkalitolerans]MBL0428319.1 tripartite tricarboxylate transporter substrate binding protein [Ramlibacter alkalitolerans]